MLSFDVNQSLVPKRERLSRPLLAKLSKALSQHLPDQARGQVEVSFVTDDDIRRLNRMYRSKDQVTDVLAFPNTQTRINGHLGEVLIAYAQARRQAEDGDLELELTDLLVHGLLHLLGYKHVSPGEAAVMFSLQDKLVAESL